MITKANSEFPAIDWQVDTSKNGYIDSGLYMASGEDANGNKYRGDAQVCGTEIWDILNIEPE